MLDVHLHGQLAECLKAAGLPPNEPLGLEVLTPAEAIHACCTLLPEFARILRDDRWRLTLDDEPLLEETLSLNVGQRQALHIRPYIEGAGEPVSWIAVGLSLFATAYALTQIPDIADYEEAEDPDKRSSYLFRGAVNATAQGGRVPLIYGGPIRVGSTLVSAGIAAERVQLTEPGGEDWDGDWYEDERLHYYGAGAGSRETRRPIEGDVTLQTRATLRAVDLLGEGPIRGLVDGLKSVFIDGTPVQNADDSLNIEGVSIETRSGLADQEPLEGIPDVETPHRFSLEVEHGSPVSRTIQNTRDSARATLRFPRLVSTNEHGDTLGATVSFRIEVQPSGGTFATVVEQTISDKTDGPAELSWRFPLEGDAPYTVRVTRTNEDSTSERVQDDLYWVGLDEIQEVRQSYPHSALVGIVAEADKYSGAVHKREYEIYGRIVQVPSNYNPATRAYAGVWDGTFKSAWTDNGAWCFYDVLTSRRFGLGDDVATEYISATKWTLYAIAQFNDRLVDDGAGGTEPRFRFTGVIQRAADAKRILDSMLSNFRSTLYYGGGAVVPVQDSPEDADVLVGAANAIDGDFTYGDALQNRDRHSAIAVTFNDPADAYKRGIELVVDDALVAKYGYRQRDVAAMYCTSRGQAHRLGKHILVEQEYESETLRYRSGLDHTHMRPGHTIRQSDPGRLGQRASVRVTDVAADVLSFRVDALPSGAPDGDATGWIAYVVLPSGTIEQRPVDTFTAATRTVALETALSAAPIDNAMCILASADVGTKLWRVLSIAERDELQLEVRAQAYHPGRYAAVESDLNLDTLELDGLEGFVAAPEAVTGRETLYMDARDTKSALLIGVTDPVAGRDPRVTGIDYELRRTDGEDTKYRPLAFQDGVLTEVRPVALGSYQLRARYVALDGAIRSAWTESAVVIVAGFLPLAAPAGVAVNATVGGYSVSWTPPPEPDYAYTKVLDRAAGDGTAVATERGRSTGTPAPMLGLNVEALLVSIRHVDRAGRQTVASQEISVTPLTAGRGASGSDGTDGQGREEAYALTAADAAPSLPSNSLGFDRLPTAPDAAVADTWYDNRPATTEALPYVWHTVRGVAGIPGQGESPYFAPLNGPIQLKAGWTNWFAARRTGRYSEDGQGREDAFALTATETAPAQPANTAGFDTFPVLPATPRAGTWYDNQPAPTEALPYVWHALRGVAGTPTVGASPHVDPTATPLRLKNGWTNWLAARIINRWVKGDKGDGLERGTDRGDWTEGEDYSVNDIVTETDTITFRTASPVAGGEKNDDGMWTFKLVIRQRYRSVQDLEGSQVRPGIDHRNWVNAGTDMTDALLGLGQALLGGGDSSRRRAFYRRARTRPAAPTAAGFDAYDTPGGGWSAENPGATARENVYVVFLTQRFTGVTEQSATTFVDNQWTAVETYETLRTGAATIRTDAGTDQAVYTGDRVTLDASNSFSSEARPLSYSWRQVSGANVVLTGADTATPNFIAPAQPGELVFELTVEVAS